MVLGIVRGHRCCHASSVARAPRECSDSSAARYSSVKLGWSCRSAKRSVSSRKASGSSRCRRARCHHLVAATVDDDDGVAFLVDALGVPGPCCDHESRAPYLTLVRDLVLDHRDEPLGDPVGALRTQPRQRVLDLGIGEPLDQLVLVVVEVHSGHGFQRGRGLVVHVVEQEPPEERVAADLVGVAVATEVAEVAHRLVAGVEQPQLHQLVGPDVVDDLHADPFELRTTEREVVLEGPLGERLAHDRPAVVDVVVRRPGACGRRQSSPG